MRIQFIAAVSPLSVRMLSRIQAQSLVSSARLKLAHVDSQVPRERGLVLRGSPRRSARPPRGGRRRRSRGIPSRSLARFTAIELQRLWLSENDPDKEPPPSARASRPGLNLTMTPRDHAIADLVAKGLTQQQVAELTGTSVRTVQRRVADPVVAAEIARLEAEGAVDEPAVATLRAALLAEKRAGVPDWTARIAAARALLSNPPDAAPEPRVITVYAPPAPASDDA